MEERGTFAQAFADAVERRGVSLRWLQRRLTELGNPVSLTTLSYWRSGDRMPERRTSVDALRSVEELLMVPAGSLQERLGATRRPGPPVARRHAAALMDPADAVERVMQQLDLAGDLDLAQSNVWVTLDVDAEGQSSHYAVQIVWTSLRDGAQRLPLLLTFTELTEPATPPVMLRGGVIRRHVIDRVGGVLGYEIVLEQPVPRGQTAITEHRMELPRDESADHFMFHTLTRRSRQVVLWVRFHPDRVPERAEAFEALDDDEKVTLLPIGNATSVHHAVNGFGPGRVGIRWSW